MCALRCRLLQTAVLLPSFAFIVAKSASAQTSTPPPILSQIASVFAGSAKVTNVQLTGTAHWHAGSLQDSGPATLTASSAGAATMQLELDIKNSWTESQSAITAGMTCDWVGSDAVVHQGDMMNCNRPAVWFLPLISLQPAIIPTGIGVIDLGTGALDAGTYRHLQIGAAFSSMPASLLTESTEASLTDIGFDPASLLPEVLSYQVHPDNGALVQVPIEIRYSNYQKTGGIEIPYIIQRFVNGSLQLEIDVTTVQIS
jgi:hypothetical protein